VEHVSPLILLQVVVVTGISALACLFARPLADRLHVFDYPRGGRKQHAHPTPQVGGFAILLPLVGWFAAKWLIPPHDPLYLALLLCGAGMAVVGVMDDQSHLSPSGRLLIVGLFTLIAFALDPQLLAPAIRWSAFGWTPIAPALFVAGAVLATAGFVSSVNMADGIDGLVPAAFLIWGVAFVVFADGPIREIAVALTGPVLIVLVFNLRGQVFLGDCGTFGIGFLFAMLAVACLRNGKPAAETLLVWFFVPVLDCLRVVAGRLLRRQSPLRGGKDHMHHILAEMFGKRSALYVYVGVIAATAALASIVPRTGIYILIALTALCLGFIMARRALSRRQAALGPQTVRSASVARFARK
jgi:UDP-GlcNAc:undecaprenyl-phosphate GlcNAc-1-phosphate transferase